MGLLGYGYTAYGNSWQVTARPPYRRQVAADTAPGSAEGKSLLRPRRSRNGPDGAGVYSHPGRPWTELREPNREAGTTVARTWV